MAVRITNVRLDRSGYRTEQTIVMYRWIDESDRKTGDNDKPSMVDFIEVKEGAAYVGTGASRVKVGIVHPQQGQPYLRTYADGVWTNNLVNLPTF